MAVNIQRLDSEKDLGLLIRGDAIERRDTTSPCKEPETGAYHRINRVGHFEFLFPAFMRDEYIIMERVRKSLIQVVDGRLVYDGDRCAIESFSQSHPDYEDLNKTLKMAGLR
jgi:hypothetical protein